jgi:hypothetical protein
MAKHKFVARIALRGDFDGEDGLGVAQQEIAAGQKGSTDDKKLYDSLLEQGYIRTQKEAAKAEEDAPAVSSSASAAPKVETGDGNKTGKTGK